MDAKYIQWFYSLQQELIALGNGPGRVKCGKSSIANQWFGYPNQMAHPDLKDYRICLLCRNEENNAVIKAEKSNTSNLVQHLHQHHHKYSLYLKELNEQKKQLAQKRSRRGEEASSSAQSMQATMDNFTIPVCQADRVLSKASKWTVDQLIPFDTFNNNAFHDFIAEFNPAGTIPSAKTIKNHVNLLSIDTKEKIKALIKGQYVALTVDHWTSKAKDNYSSLMVHYINDDDLLVTHILACEKHSGHTQGEDILFDLLEALKEWGILENKFVSLVSYMEAKMNKAGRLLEGRTYSIHMYCICHVTQLTAELGFSGGRMLDCLKKLIALVTHFNKST